MAHENPLARARERAPGGRFGLGMTEFARVLRPGGHLVTSGIHPERVARGAVPPVRLPDGRPGRLESHHHPAGDYVRAALAAGLVIRRCEEPAVERPEPPGTPAAGPGPGPWELWPWCLADLIPDASGAAEAGVPAEIIWHFRLSPPSLDGLRSPR